MTEIALSDSAYQLSFAQSMLESGDPGLTPEEKRNLYINAVRSFRENFPAAGWVTYDVTSVRSCLALGIDIETLEPLDGALQQPVDSDITYQK